MSMWIVVNSPSVVSNITLGHLEYQTLRNSKMSVVTPKAAHSIMGGLQHKISLGGPHGNSSTKLTYPLPDKLVNYLTGFGLSSQAQKKAITTWQEKASERGSQCRTRDSRRRY